MADKKPSAGYPNIEKLIDSEQFDDINKAFSKAYEQLNKMSKEKKGLKNSREAGKALKAIERVTELLKELLQIKYRLQEMMTKNQKKQL